MKSLSFSIVILTYNRPEKVQFYLEYLEPLSAANLEVIFVDNGSEVFASSIVPEERYKVVRNDKNLGAVGRNKGIQIATGDIIVTLDDDVYGLKERHLEYLRRIFEQKPDIGAVNFRVQEEGTGRIANWCHPYDSDKFCHTVLETNCISEGAVAFRRAALTEVGLYPEEFFISHEGPDLACRLINRGWRIIYHPDIVVTHAYERQGRASWRRYYYDTRNQLWLVLRNFPPFYGLKKLIIGWGTMLIYSIRDGYFLYWLKAVLASLRHAPKVWQDRTPLRPEAMKRWRLIERQQTGFWKKVRKRLWCREVKI